jgi:HEAT repeat protein
MPQLIAALKDPDLLVRREVSKVLGQMGPEARSAVPALIEVFKSTGTGKARPKSTGRDARTETTLTKIAAAEALGNIGPDAKSALPLFEEVMKDTKLRDRTFRQAVQSAMRKIQASKNN